MSKAHAGGRTGVDENAPNFTNKTAGGWCWQYEILTLEIAEATFSLDMGQR